MRFFKSVLIENFQLILGNEKLISGDLGSPFEITPSVKSRTGTQNAQC